MEPFLLAALVVVAGAGIAAAVQLVRQRQATAGLREQNAVLARGLDLREKELKHLADVRLPELMESLHNPGLRVAGPLHDLDREAPAYGQALTTVTELFAGSAARVRERADLSAKSTLRAMMRAVQSLANEQQLAISHMQERHDDPDVLEDLLRIDHMNAQLGRRAQATAVLCGSWPGQQRSASSMSDVVRGATGRIRDYLRVNLQGPVNTAVTSRAVEPIVLTLAELLDNAARHSRPDTTVEVNFQPTHNGVAIMIDDAGVAMDTEELQRAADLLSGDASVDIHRLGDPPRVGFAVAGVLAARYGFRVSVDTRSPYGGVRAVVFVPAALLADLPDERRPGPAASARPAEEQEQEQTAPAAGTDVPATAGGLPKRSRVAVAERPADAAGDTAGGGPEEAGARGTGEWPAARPARETAAGLGAWQRGTRSGRAAAAPDADGPGIESKDLRP
ncbi:ATP-binding protein [Actinomadura darangshiensis]|uniref:histidine kinase n=1 Tax=Actinomadura darangshiensis TaxID=705336 RepID=A0A4R5BY79_9ACTN|nr:ATP-binding protein [Actinomadura darangshiensis]TDD92178.1 ATP-binding protein [Actinomadura darangshiensis]